MSMQTVLSVFALLIFLCQPCFGARVSFYSNKNSKYYGRIRINPQGTLLEKLQHGNKKRISLRKSDAKKLVNDRKTYNLLVEYLRQQIKERANNLIDFDSKSLGEIFNDYLNTSSSLFNDKRHANIEDFLYYLLIRNMIEEFPQIKSFSK